MTSNLTLITTLVITAAMASAGTYYLTTNEPASANPVVDAAHPPSEPQQPPVAIAVDQQPNKPVEIIIKTEVVEKHRQTGQHDFIAEGIAARNRPQPHYEVLK